MQSLKNLKFSTKILLGIFIPLFLVCISLGFYMIDRIRNDAMARLDEKGETINKLLAKISVIPIITHDYWALEEYIQEIIKDKEIVYAVILDKNGYDAITTTSSKPLNNSLKGIKVYKTAISHNATLIGGIETGISTQQYKEELFRDILFFSIVTGSTILLCYIISYFISKATTQPLIRIVEKMKEVEKRNFTVRQAVDTSDEIGELARGFNEMLDEIQKRDEELKQHHLNLEAKVTERTAELDFANKNLQRELQERKAAEEALKQSNDFSKNLLKSMNDAILIFKKLYSSPDSKTSDEFGELEKGFNEMLNKSKKEINKLNDTI